MTLGPSLRRHAEVDISQLQPGIDPDEHRALLAHVVSRFGAEDGEEAVERFGELLRRIGLASRLDELGVESRDRVMGIAHSVNVDRLSNNPVILSERDLGELLTSGHGGGASL